MWNDGIFWGSGVDPHPGQQPRPGCGDNACRLDQPEPCACTRPQLLPI